MRAKKNMFSSAQACFGVVQDGEAEAFCAPLSVPPGVSHGEQDEG